MQSCEGRKWQFCYHSILIFRGCDRNAQNTMTQIINMTPHAIILGEMQSSATGESSSESQSVSQETIAPSKPATQSAQSVDLGGSTEAPKVSQSTSDVEAAFDDLFNN